MNLSKVTDYLTIIYNVSLTTRMQIILTGIRIIVNFVIHTNTC